MEFTAGYIRDHPNEGPANDRPNRCRISTFNNSASRDLLRSDVDGGRGSDRASRRPYRDELLEARRHNVSAICVGLDGFDPLANLGRALEHEVFNHDAGGVFLPEDTAREYTTYEKQSSFFLCVEVETMQVVGALRAIIGSAGFGPMVKTMYDCLYLPEYEKPFIDLRDEQLPPVVREVGRIGKKVNHRLPRLGSDVHRGLPRNASWRPHLRRVDHGRAPGRSNRREPHARRANS